ncbi:MAG: response regulator [Candidatus Dadabacteria bacterium]|nr:MAG: response regulator [Candidatus Dadabacteria bacterium]
MDIARNFSLRTKLIAIPMAIAVTVLLLVSLPLVFYQYKVLRSSKIVQLSVVSDLIANSSTAAIVFNDTTAAQELLQKLSIEKEVESAYLVGRDGKVFAHYSSAKGGKADIDLKVLTKPYKFKNGYVYIKKPVTLDGQLIGYVYLKSRTLSLKQQIKEFLWFVLFIAAVGFVFAAYGAARFQRYIMKPLTMLSDALREISEKGNYSVRIPVTGQDEIGVLVSGYNKMADIIQSREKALIDARDRLEERVKERTLVLEQEIAQRKRAEEALLREQEQLRQIISVAPVPIAMLDKGLRFLGNSKMWKKDFSSGESQILRKNFFDIFPDKSQKWKEYLKKGLRGEVVSESEEQIVLSDGSNGYVSFAVQPWLEPEGDIGGVIVVMERIDDLIKAREEAIKSAELRLQFLANVSHEIRTPLNGIVGFSELLSGTSLSDEQREYVDILKSSSEILLRLIDDVLDFSKVSSGSVELENAPFSIREEIKTVVKRTLVSASSGVYIRAQIADDVPDILYGDKFKLIQVVANLLSNAVKFTQEGEIIISVKLHTRKKDGSLTLSFCVSDTGIGIPEEKHKAIFDPFIQADGSVTREYGGTGLGLAICAHIVKLFGGRIWVESKPGKGSKFFFTVNMKEGDKMFCPVAPSELHPVSLGQGTESEIKAHENKESTKSINILVVEDNLVNQKLVARMLTKQGYNVIVAGNGKEAIDIVRKEKIDLVFMDIQMPVMGGLEATEKIREMENGHRIPIIALTAHAFAEHREECLKKGMDDFITKPVNRRELLKKAQEAAEGKITPKV